MESFELKAKDAFGEIVIKKSLIHQAGFGNRAIPTYVGEWIIAHFVGEDDDHLTSDSRERIADFIQKYAPEKGLKESVKNRLFKQEEVQLLDNYAVSINLDRGDRTLSIPFLDESNAFVSPQIVEDNKMLLSSGLWGVGTLFYTPPAEKKHKGQIWLKDFKPFQLANVDMDYFCEQRQQFTTEEWINLIVSSMGFNPITYNERQKTLLISRLIPMVEPRYNLVEPAPKGTGKSFVFDNISRYVAVRSGSVTPAVLFFNDSKKSAGLITKHDCVVIDEAQKVKTDSSGELTALLKSYLESGKFGRGSAGSITAEGGIVLLANIDMDDRRQPVHEEVGIFRFFPNFLRETAFIDRFAGLLPGWYLPRITKKTPSNNLGFKGDIFGEILHLLKSDVSYRDYVKMNMELNGCEDMRDSKAIESGASGLLKILFPDKNPSDIDFYKYCVNPAIELRQRIKDELCKLDREYKPNRISSKYPDDFQNHHKLPSYREIDVKEMQKSEKQAHRVAQNRINFEPVVDLSVDREPRETTIKIKEGGTGYSYKNLFYPYLKDAQTIKIEDPYIRTEYQLRNFISLCEIIAPPSGYIDIHLTTKPDNDWSKQDLTEKLADLQQNLLRYRIKFTFDFNDVIHDRKIETDTGWRIKPGRGLDIFQKPDGKYTLGESDQTKRRCKETEIDFLRIKAEA